ncbi:MAG: MerR family transcriptional regulator [Deltaproteobacteria bacterium]|nr:MerR family transcriptional regulator [Deltaproteobacteria bacterium]
MDSKSAHLEGIRKYENRNDLRLDELVETANRFMRQVAPVQPSRRIAQRVNERTLRYYIGKGLVDRPLGKSGTAALYGFKHLLQILALKRLQAAYLPVRRIKDILPGMDEQGLWDLITGGKTDSVPPADASTKDYLDWVWKREQQIPLEESRAEFLPDLLEERSLSAMEEKTWHRFPVSEGVELHIRADRARQLGLHQIRDLLHSMFAHMVPSEGGEQDGE